MKVIQPYDRGDESTVAVRWRMEKRMGRTHNPPIANVTARLIFFFLSRFMLNIMGSGVMMMRMSLSIDMPACMYLSNVVSHGQDMGLIQLTRLPCS